MTAWPNKRFLDVLRIDLPIIQAPMAGASGAEMAIAVARAGGLGSLPCAILSIEQAHAEIARFRAAGSWPLNLNFFCHAPPALDRERDAAWKKALAPYYEELAITPDAALAAPTRSPFNESMCGLVEASRPEVVSFHFGLPDGDLLNRVKATGAKVLSTATTVGEARWLEAHGCDALIAQGAEAGGHRGMFLTRDVTTQVGTLALVPQVVDAVSIPVIAAGGIADARGIVAAFALGAGLVQIGTAYLFCPEAIIDPLHRAALLRARDTDTAITNMMTGRPARAIMNRLMREMGPMSPSAPEFPLASSALAPLRSAARTPEDFAQRWSGQAAPLGIELPAEVLTRQLADRTRAF